MRAIQLSNDQTVHCQTMKQWAERADANPALRGDRAYVEQAERLLERAADLQIPMPFPLALQSIVSVYRSEEELPQHLRGDWFKG